MSVITSLLYVAYLIRYTYDCCTAHVNDVGELFILFKADAHGRVQHMPCEGYVFTTTVRVYAHANWVLPISNAVCL